MISILRDPLKHTPRDEIISQLEDRSAYCKKCGLLRYTAPLSDMPDEFVKYYKENFGNELLHDIATFKYCGQCEEYDEQTENIFRKINQ